MAGDFLLITGGGTGGHVSPGLGVATEWLRRHGEGSVAWVGRADSIEETMAARAGLPFHAVESAAFKRQWTLNNLAIPGVLLAGLRQAGALLEARPPAAVLMTGGYVGLPLSLAALRARKPLLLLEPNAVPGLANRLLKPLAAKLCLGWPAESPSEDPSVVVTGIPCRLGALPDRKEARLGLGLQAERRTLLVLPGSQAARAINAALREALPNLGDRAELWQWIWMCGAAEEEECRAAAAAAPFPIQVHAFIHDTATAYAAADLVLCRSGASTLAELGVAGKPSLQVPYPHATGDHQRANAAAFARNGAAVLLDADDLSAESLLGALRRLMDGDLSRMAAAARTLGQPQAAQKVADLIEEAAGLKPAA
ncbi:MAG TPA: UDP-N-acetylglucosamine--N-acetylmuramyl-(pentapeptide) pyrophosphoryl-undecaprenol N-acetylglucosamine transferase [bacterium]|jgi:UDP-N-acetylglucosamine--N-acetylmuramyl-(pentapeptide) pyrophosphoryl-undecaprenol N-acetylglucosamine transferase|nr:UDP-N-acetylglucosamine--N-acetylmuramyl-(pentapeptide) pyrophosphoryl-undecaprenol N-acetylglucosamine transferase [bacterium]